MNVPQCYWSRSTVYDWKSGTQTHSGGRIVNLASKRLVNSFIQLIFFRKNKALSQLTVGCYWCRVRKTKSVPPRRNAIRIWVGSFLLDRIHAPCTRPINKRKIYTHLYSKTRNFMSHVYHENWPIKTLRHSPGGRGRNGRVHKTYTR